jgi:hypothetical protein
MDARAFFLLQYDVIRMLTDELLLAGVNDDQLRHAPGEDHHSLAWLLWHTSRWEDVALTMLEREALQVLDQNRLFDRLGVAHRDIGAAMSADECLSFNTTVDLAALRTYYAEVELRTQTVVEALWSEELSELVPETRFRQVMQAGAIGEPDGVWLERFLMNRSKAWWLSSVIWHQTTHLLGEATWLRHQAGAPLNMLTTRM